MNDNVSKAASLIGDLIELTAETKELSKNPAESETTGPDLDLRKPPRLECVASSMSGVTIFSVMSVRTVNVGTTMKSMNPAYTEKVNLLSVAEGLRR